MPPAQVHELRRALDAALKSAVNGGAAVGAMESVSGPRGKAVERLLFLDATAVDDRERAIEVIRSLLREYSAPESTEIWQTSPGRERIGW